MGSCRRPAPPSFGQLRTWLRRPRIARLPYRIAPWISAVAFLVPLVFPAAAQDTPSARGFDHFYNLEYDQALAEFKKAAQIGRASCREECRTRWSSDNE